MPSFLSSEYEIRPGMRGGSRQGEGVVLEGRGRGRQEGGRRRVVFINIILLAEYINFLPRQPRRKEGEVKEK